VNSLTRYAEHQAGTRTSSRSWTVVVAWLLALLVLGGVMIAGAYTVPHYPAGQIPINIPSPRAPV
jgi:hypothetical protein